MILFSNIIIGTLEYVNERNTQEWLVSLHMLDDERDVIQHPN